MTKKTKEILLGILLGFLAPVVASPLVAYFLYMGKPICTDQNGLAVACVSFGNYYSSLISNPYNFFVFIRLCGLGILPVFLFVMNKGKQDLGRGMLISAAVITIGILIASM